MKDLEASSSKREGRKQSEVVENAKSNVGRKVLTFLFTVLMISAIALFAKDPVLACTYHYFLSLNSLIHIVSCTFLSFT